MKKLIKNEICGSVNSAQMHCSLKKVNICGYCSLNSSRTPPKTRENKKKKKKKKNKTQTWFMKRESKQRLRESWRPLGRARNNVPRELMLHSRNWSIRSWSTSRMSLISDGQGRWVETWRGEIRVYTAHTIERKGSLLSNVVCWRIT